MKYIVEFMVTGHVVVEVEADDVNEAIEKAGCMNLDYTDMGCLDVEAEAVYDEDEELVWEI